MNNFLIKTFLLISILLQATVLFCEDMTMDNLLLKMEAAEKNIENMQFDFNQDLIYNLTNEKQSNKGQIIFKKPNNLYIKQNNTLDQIIISNGSKVWIYTPSYKQVIVDSWKKWISTSMVPSSMLNFGRTWQEMKKAYSFKYEGIDNGKYLILLTPNKKDMWQMKFWINMESFVPEKTALIGENINIITETKNYKINQELDKKIFNFKASPDVEILNLP